MGIHIVYMYIYTYCIYIYILYIYIHIVYIYISIHIVYIYIHTYCIYIYIHIYMDIAYGNGWKWWLNLPWLWWFNGDFWWGYSGILPLKWWFKMIFNGDMDVYMEFYGTYQFYSRFWPSLRETFEIIIKHCGPLGNPRSSEFLMGKSSKNNRFSIVTIQWVDVGSQNGDPRIYLELPNRMIVQYNISI
jgi:hypothetical protein